MALLLEPRPASDVILSLSDDNGDIDLYAKVGDESILIAFFHKGILQLTHNSPREVALLGNSLNFTKDGILSVQD
jgi:hypothetical protein